MEEISQNSLKRGAGTGYDSIKQMTIPEAISQAQTLSNLGVDRVLPRDITTGTMRGQQNIGSNNLIIDGSGNRILLNDGVTTRMIIGFDAGGF